MKQDNSKFLSDVTLSELRKAIFQEVIGAVLWGCAIVIALVKFNEWAG